MRAHLRAQAQHLKPNLSSSSEPSRAEPSQAREPEARPQLGVGIMFESGWLGWITTSSRARLEKNEPRWARLGLPAIPINN